MRKEDLGVDVSRETFEKLEAFHSLVLKWNPTINLVSKSNLSELWERHIRDSAQIVQFGGVGSRWLDIGSGGGFPALVVAIVSRETAPERKVIMIESDRRKASFLRTCIRELELPASVIAERIEKAPSQNAQVLSARALSDLANLLHYADRHLAKRGKALFMKGASWQNEVDAARESWSFELKAHTSITNPSAAILEIKDIERV